MTSTRYNEQELVTIFALPGERKQRHALDELAENRKHGESLLIRVYDTQPKPSIRRWAVEGLCAFQSEEAATRIRTSLFDKNMSVRLHAVSGVRRRSRQEFLPDLVLLLSDTSGAIRLNVLQTLVAMDPSQASVHLAEGLHDEKAYVRSFAAKALAGRP